MGGHLEGRMRIAVLGLGEAGSRWASELAAHGDEVHAFDPGDVPTPDGVRRHRDPGQTVAGAELILALTPGSEAVRALTDVLDELGGASLYADLSTAAPSLKGKLAAIAADRGIVFADVALMAAIPGRGIAAPALASGPGAGRFAEMVNTRGGSVEVVGSQAGEAATRKLLRSVVMKGLAALLIESMSASSRLGKADWLWGHLVDELTSMDVAMMERLLFDTAPHATRRVEEMEAAREMLRALGAPGEMTESTLAWLRRLEEEGMPELPVNR